MKSSIDVKGSSWRHWCYEPLKKKKPLSLYQSCIIYWLYYYLHYYNCSIAIDFNKKVLLSEQNMTTIPTGPSKNHWHNIKTETFFFNLFY